MRIGFDVDGVLADFNRRFIELIIKVTGEDRFPARPFDIPTWHYPQHYGYSAEVMDFEHGPVWGTVRASGSFWAELPMYPWTRDVLDELARRRHNDGDDIYFITDRPGRRAKRQTEDWLHDLGYEEATVLISGAKDLCAQALKLDAYIDDRFENASKVGAASPATRSFLLTRPWNAHYIPAYSTRIETPAKMFELLDEP